jgi:hypothetical protein
MKKNFLFIIVTMFIAAAGWMSCQKIDEPLVVINERDFPEIPDDTTGGDTTINNFITTYVDERQVLLEEFTGHLCVNCPEAAKLAHDLAEELDHKLIIYSVHAGNFAEPVPGTIFESDLRSDESEALYANFAIFANPLALVDRIEYNGLRQIFKDDWATVVNQQLALPNEVNLRLSNTWYPDLKVVVVDVEAEFVSVTDDNYKLVVYIVEDSIVSPQLNNDPAIGGDTLYNYVHRNLLRDAVNSTYGDFLGDAGQVVTGEVYEKQYTYPVNEDWVTENCRIIAYIGKQNASLNLIDLVQVAELEIKVDEE